MSKSTLSNGEKVERIEGAEHAKIAKLFKAYETGNVRLGKQRYFYPVEFLKYAEEYLNFQFRPSDVLIATYPKCGTTWTQEIVWTMLHNADLTNPRADDQTDQRSPHIEFDSLCENFGDPAEMFPDMAEYFAKHAPGLDTSKGMYLEFAKKIGGRRVLKTHLPFSLLPKDVLDKCKVIYVARNPKDVVVSYLHHHRILKGYQFVGTDSDFVDYFCNGDVQCGSYAAHLGEAHLLAGHPNLLNLTYEKLQEDKMAAIETLQSFLGMKLSATQIQNVAEMSTFGSMKKRLDDGVTSDHAAPGTEKKADQDKTEGFYRKGKSGSWRTDMAPELSQKIDGWIAEEITKPYGITFPGH